jgi:hypothetical protein
MQEENNSRIQEQNKPPPGKTKALERLEAVRKCYNDSIHFNYERNSAKYI